ncbi:exodeoxyribonuclease VII large subunit [Alphaproteobacteria bacterium KMM 3653]|uniref:Exodeoxyribonuclease 7 large subunit n=1 Tax=Harenicola maris TaxID=2841044 RepID=A0AAP2CR84_9RHOB|nr:exodeoxyribonuclease VII large subunit [Harenicola maris]
MDLIDDPQPGENAPEFTVGEISGAVKRVLEGEFGRIRVRGEVGRVVLARSGHMYFDVKDDRNSLACTSWKGQVSRLTVRPEEGMEVVVTGKMSAFGGQSKYNMNVDDVVVAGEGALMAMLDKRRRALEAEGLFAPERKQPLPYLPEVIGVITSPTGAVIRDILHRLRDRFPRKVLVWPVAVQGKDCAPQVARAIAGFNAMTPGGALPRPDLLIVARGGGSIEDLWGFNEEIVARAAGASDIPLISAVGHETDTTLIDHAADRRAPTPTAAAELAVPVRVDLLAWLEGQGGRLMGAAARGLGQRQQRVADLARALPSKDSLLAHPLQRFDLASRDLPRALMRGVERRGGVLGAIAGRLRPQLLLGRIAQGREASAKLEARRGPALSRSVALSRRGLVDVSARLRLPGLSRDITRRKEALAGLAGRLEAASKDRLAREDARVAALGRVLGTLGYHQTLQRGFAVVRAGGAVVTTAQAAQGAAALEVQFADARVNVVPLAEGADTPTTPVPAVPAAPAAAKPKPKAKRAKPAPPEQGDLF